MREVLIATRIYSRFKNRSYQKYLLEIEMTEENKDLKYKINQPETSFPMRGDLAKREPAWLKHWQDKKLYERIRKSRKGKTDRKSVV